MRATAGDGEITPEIVFQAARHQDPVALDVVRKTVEYLGVGLTNVIHLLNPRVIALGGGIANGGADLLVEPLRDEVARTCGGWVNIEGTEIVLGSLGDAAPLLGVAGLTWGRFP